MGAYMITAFLLGLWCMHSFARSINSIVESLILTIIAIIVKTIMERSSFPAIDEIFISICLILFIYTAIVLKIIQIFSGNSFANMLISIGGAIGWFFLASYVFSDEGIKLIHHSLNTLFH